MTTQIRTWEEVPETEDTPRSWYVSINGTPVPGGYIEKLEDGYRIHYPHLASKTFKTLKEAKYAIEKAPPVSREGMKIGKVVSNADEDELISTEEAADMLGVTRYRVNAMVANGVLAGTRRDGQTLVSRSSVEAKINRTSTGPAGKFAHTFICYYPPLGEGSWIMAEVDTDEEDQVDVANQLIESISNSDSQENAEVLDYHGAMARFAKVRKGLDTGGTTQTVTVEELAAQREVFLEEEAQAKAEAEAEAEAQAQAEAEAEEQAAEQEMQADEAEGTAVEEAVEAAQPAEAEVEA